MINGKHKLASPSTKQLVSDKCHKHEHHINQSHASGSDNFKGAEEVVDNSLQELWSYRNVTFDCNKYLPDMRWKLSTVDKELKLSRCPNTTCQSVNVLSDKIMNAL